MAWMPADFMKGEIMPTGYTYQIQQGISFEQFVLSCAKAFGACITMRDEPMDTPIPEKFEPSDYHIKRIAEIKDQLQLIESYSESQCEEMAKQQYDDRVAQLQSYIDRDKLLLIKYNNMLSKVNKWQPPTSEHEELKKFMIEQIESSIKFDCSMDYWKNEIDKIKLKSGKRWKEDEIERLNKDLEYQEKINEEEIKRANGRNLWIKQLRDSLKKE